jgi:hypothetical protein
MARGILIAGNESSLSEAIAAEAAKRVEAFAAAFIPRHAGEQVRGKPFPGGGSPRFPLRWNPGSPISARSLVLAAENRLEQVDEAILICTPPSVYERAEELVPSEIETTVNNHIKGWFFLVRELTSLFKARNRGVLSLVLSDLGGGKDEAVDMMGPSVAASFRAFTQGLLASSFSEPYHVLAFSSSEIGEEGAFAAFVFKVMEEKNKRNTGKWHRYGRLGFFGR